MKKHFLVLLALFTVLGANAQSRGMKIAYIDMEYILDKVPDYAEAKNQLEQKAQKWKQEIEVKRNDINKLKESLDTEKALLTIELIEEREEEIKFLEKELIDYQEKRFGPTGDLITQKAVLVKPIQDQVFNIVRDLAESRNYDFIFDKSSDLTMLFAANRHDISDFVVGRLTRAAKRKQLSGKELKQFEEMEKQEELELDPAYQEKQQVIEDRKAEKEKRIEERRKAQEEKRRQYEERREQIRQEREAERQARQNGNQTEEKSAAEGNRPAGEDTQSTGTGNTDPAQDAREERERKNEERSKTIEERKKQLQEQREAAQKAREEQRNRNTPQNEENSTPDTQENNQEENGTE